MVSHSPESGEKRKPLPCRQRAPSLARNGIAGMFEETEVVGIQEMVRFRFALFRLFDARQCDEPEYGPNHACVWMVLPNRVGQHLDHDLTHLVIAGAAQLIEQRCYPPSGRRV